MFPQNNFRLLLFFCLSNKKFPKLPLKNIENTPLVVATFFTVSAAATSLPSKPPPIIVPHPTTRCPEASGILSHAPVCACVYSYYVNVSIGVWVCVSACDRVSVASFKNKNCNNCCCRVVFFRRRRKKKENVRNMCQFTWANRP